MARRPTPIRSLVKHAKAYDLDIKTAYLTPLAKTVQNRFATAVAAREALLALDTATDAVISRPYGGVPRDLVEKHLRSMEGWHRDRLHKTFRRSLAVDIRSFLLKSEIEDFMRQRIAENVDLIKTIPPRFHDALKASVLREFADKPFDQQALMAMFEKEYKSAGYNLRRLTRDQTNKQIGQLTQKRHGQIGIQKYEWLTVSDERVRTAHRILHGQIFEWAKPPMTGHPGDAVQCRCSASPVIDKALLSKLKGDDTVVPSAPSPPSPSPIVATRPPRSATTPPDTAPPPPPAPATAVAADEGLDPALMAYQEKVKGLKTLSRDDAIPGWKPSSIMADRDKWIDFVEDPDRLVPFRSGEFGDMNFLEFMKMRRGPQGSRVVSGADFDDMPGEAMFRGIDNAKYIQTNIDATSGGGGLYGNGLYFGKASEYGMGRAVKYAADQGHMFAAKLADDAVVIHENTVSVAYKAIMADKSVPRSVKKWLEQDDLGRTAALLRADAIQLRSGDAKNAWDTMVVLNRSKLAFDERAMPGGQLYARGPAAAKSAGWVDEIKEDWIKFYADDAVAARRSPAPTLAPEPAAPVVDEIVKGLDLDSAIETAHSKMHRRLKLRSGDNDVEMPTTADINAAIADNFKSGDYMAKVKTALSEDNVAIYTAMKETNLKKAIRENKIKSQSETGKSSMKVDIERRFESETEIFGLSASTLENDINLMPKYGFISGRKKMDFDQNKIEAYGDAYVRMKPEMRSRTTVTLGDSLNNNDWASAAPARPINDLDETFLWPMTEVDDKTKKFISRRAETEELVASRPNLADIYQSKLDALDRFEATPNYNDLIKARGSEYIEAQMFGKVTFDNVEAIVVKSDASKKSIEGALKKAGLKDIVVEVME